MRSSSLRWAQALSLCALVSLLGASATWAAPLPSITYDANYNFSLLTPAKATVNLPQWNPASFPSKVLVAAKLAVSGNITSNVTAENNMNFGGELILSLQGTVSASGPSGLAVLAPILRSYEDIVGPSNGVPNSGPDFRNYVNIPASLSAEAGPIVAGLAPYTGSGSFAVPVNGNAAFSVLGDLSPATVHTSSIFVSGQVHVTYLFVPEPGSIALASLGGAGLAIVVWKRRSRARRHCAA